jgi:haloalkane dehalogenase
VAEIVQAYSEWLSHSTIPKLLVNGDPGGSLTGTDREFCQGWPAQTEVTVRGIHFLQEDSPDEIGQTIARWVKTLKL